MRIFENDWCYVCDKVIIFFYIVSIITLKLETELFFFPFTFMLFYRKTLALETWGLLDLIENVVAANFELGSL